MADITLPSHLESYYRKGMDALEKNNFDYATELLLQVVQEEPLHAPSRKSLRLAERSKLDADPPSKFTLFLLKLNSLIPLIMGLVYETLKKYKEALAFYEEVLKYFPNDLSVLKKIAQIGKKLNSLDVVLVAHEDILEVVPNDMDCLKKLAGFYREKGQITLAKSYLKRIISAHPLDQDAKKDLKDIEALSTIQDGNWEDQQSYRTKIKTTDSSPASSSTADAGSPAESSEALIRQLEGQLKEDPSNLDRLQTLAAAYKQVERLEDAERAYAHLLRQNPTHGGYREAYRELSELNYIRKRNALNEKLSFAPNDATLQAQLNTLKQKRQEQMVERLRQDVASYPNDLNFRFELGVALAEAGQFDEAIVQFQLAVKDPAKHASSLYRLGLCFKEKRMYDLAVIQFEKALEKDASLKEANKEIIYQLAQTLEVMGKREEAFQQYKRIYEVDIAFRDIAQKMESYYRKP